MGPVHKSGHSHTEEASPGGKKKEKKLAFIQRSRLHFLNICRPELETVNFPDNVSVGMSSKPIESAEHQKQYPPLCNFSQLWDTIHPGNVQAHGTFFFWVVFGSCVSSERQTQRRRSAATGVNLITVYRFLQVKKVKGPLNKNTCSDAFLPPALSTFSSV